MTLESINPRDGSRIASYDTLVSDALGTVLSVASMAFGEWRSRSVTKRAEAIRTLGERILANESELARLMTDEMGKPIRESRAELQKCATLCHYYAEEGPSFLTPRPVETEASSSYVRHDPLGPILGIMPWNYPVWQVVRFAVPTLLTGNVVLLKHAPNVTGCALTIERLFRDAGLTEGIYTALLLDVEQVDKVIADPRVAGVSLTGSVAAGQAVAEAAGRHLKPVVLELGGSDPFIVLDDADLDAAAEAGVTSRMLNSGQSCIAAKRFLVEAGVHDAFVARLKERIDGLVLGDPREEDTEVGPLARPDLVSNLHFQVKTSVDLGAKVVTGGEPVERPGNYYRPTLLTEVKRGMPVFDEETFGPVASVIRVEHEAELLELANGSLYGLGAAVFSGSERGEALVPQLDAGYVAVNAFVRSDPRLPFGGIKHSGYGRELSREGLYAFSNLKTVWVQD